MREIPLSRKYAPRRIADLAGQSYARFHLGEFCAAPYSTAFLFSGDPGCGKTSAAHAIAGELGAHPTSGVWDMSGTDQSDERLDMLSRELRFAPFGDGWRVVIVDECDWLMRCPKLLLKWNPILDNGATRTVFVFTTNTPESFAGVQGERFLRRVQHLPFTSDVRDLIGEVRELVARIWAGEGISGHPPRIPDIPGAVQGDKLSIGRLIQGIEFAIRDSRSAEKFKLSARSDAPRSLFQAAAKKFKLSARSDAPRSLFQAAAMRPRFEYDPHSGKLVKSN